MSTATAASGQAVVPVQAPSSTLSDPSSPSPLTPTDIVVFALILVFGAAAFLFHLRSIDFLGEDVFYADCARSLLAHGFYGIAGRPETNQPPGLPAILATLFAIFGYSHPICLRAMAVFEALGFLASYELLRRRLPKLVAAAICILPISSPQYFRIATVGVWPCFPVFFTMMAALLAFEEYEKASTPTWRILWGLVLTSTVVASMMIASAAMSLLSGMVAVIGVTALKDRRLALARLKRLLPILLMGIAAQALWMHRKPAPLEWPLPGYPAPYLQQLKVKSGNYPELGMANLADISTRIAENLSGQSGLFIQVLLRHGVDPSKEWILIVPGLVIAMGWIYSVWQTGGRLPEWFFAGYESIYLAWPWKVEERFFFPVLPLACLYAWQGIKAIHFLATRKPRAVGAVCLPLGVLFGVSAWYWVYTHWGFAGHGLGLFPDELMAPVWCILALCAARMVYTGRPPSFLIPSSSIGGWFARPLRWWRESPWRLTQDAIWMVVVALVGIGVAMQVSIARDNVRFVDLSGVQDSSRNVMGPEVEGALWIRAHTPVTSTVMARHLPTVFHYAHRKLVWFAPTSNPHTLMQGIVRLNVDYVIVIRHKEPYYLPDDDYCVDRLLATYGGALQIVFRDTNLRIFQVNRQQEGFDRTDNGSHAMSLAPRSVTQN